MTRLQDRLDDIVRLYRGGLSVPEIARVTLFSDSGIYKVLTEAGIHKRGTKQRLRKQLSPTGR
jgi:hypothetical protein